jgi:hypothetical protein
VFTSVTLDDFRKIMKEKPMNAIHLISHVSLSSISKMSRLSA